MEPSASPPWFIDSRDPETTYALAALLGRSIGARGLAIGLVGPLGAGKTVFVKGLAEGLGVDPRVVSSPTFVIAQEYPIPEGPERLHHLDFYRLASEAELESIGFLDLLGPGQVLAVEWLDRFPDALGPDRLEIVFLPAAGAAPGGAGETETATEGAGRRIRVTAHGDEAARVLADWASRWARIAPPGAVGATSAPGRGRLGRADLKLLLALGTAGWIALDAFVGGGLSPDLRPGLATGVTTADGRVSSEGGCVALAPEEGGSRRDRASRDELGPLRVRCLTKARPGAPCTLAELEGMARLLGGGRLDPNVASRRLLESLPGIGPGRAAAIEAERGRAPFGSLRALERVPGIGPKTREGLEPFLAVDSRGAPG
ncbi:MAG: tRNA (adenosine(37)-N6)-threonylcarbamoyltransferase complex ATPase subunit type 1 TsaE [Deltaproteobacteria bacterium]|nr:tRNA (adenosine(37)-N6)-threonylcarbamoyltransferase complex ATPase subunit type 1 TsaE [Deltaproteobacteria bacterium]